MFELTRKDGVVTGVRKLSGAAWSAPEGAVWEEFLKWNDAQPADKKLDLSNKTPEPVVDSEAPMQQRLIDYLKLDPAAATRHGA